MPDSILKVALDVPLERLFDYHDGGFPVKVGQRVVVTFGPKQLIGVVIERASTSEVPLEKLKSIESAYLDEPALDSATLKLLQFCASYYHYPMGQALLNSLPARLRQRKEAQGLLTYRYSLTAQGLAAHSEEWPARQKIVRQVHAALAASANGLSERELSDLSPSWRKALAQLKEKGWIEQSGMLAGLETALEALPAPTLKAAQAQAVERVVNGDPGFKPYLLHGITGSGKTEVYMQMLDRLLADTEAQALVLVPEINLTPQLEQRFRQRLPHLPLVALHSHLNESERLQHWRLAQSGQAKIVIGTRLSVFCPLPTLRLIVVDEEHDSSYKQQDSMRYHARDVAIVRAQQLGIPIVLGSATPALESWHHAQTGKYHLLSLQERAVAQARLPQIDCVNTQNHRSDHGLTPRLIEALKTRLERGEQSLLFINRRGYAPVLLCNACHWIAPCMRCSSRLVVHLRQGRLRCHHCGHEQAIVKQCPSCGNPDLHPTGQGTQRLEESLQSLFPTARIRRVDRDSTSRKEELQAILDRVHRHEIDILVGTQMLAKGHDFPNLTLVGVIDTDSALYSPDFRASERLFAQLMQVAGRAGRAEKPGEVLIQTSYPEHPLFLALRAQNYALHADALLKERALAQFPPYRFIALIRAEATHYQAVSAFLNEAFEAVRAWSKAVDCFEPMPAHMQKLNGMERGQLLLQAAQRAPLQQLLRQLSPYLRGLKTAQKVRWSIDVDPLDF